MKKMFLAAALAVGMCVPVYANFDDNSDASIYATPVYDEDANSASVVKKSAREENMGKALPIKMTGDQAEYDSVSGDFHLSGNVVITQGAEKLLTTHAHGNMKTGDVWLDQGGTIVEAGTRMSGKWVHYNFNTKTGEIKEITGKSEKEWFDAPHATILSDKLVVDEGGYMSRCPSKEHPPCLSIKAKTFEIYPQEKMVAHDVKVFVRGKHVYSRDIWVNEVGARKMSIMPRVGYAGSDNGTFAKLDINWQMDEKTSASAELIRYKKAGYKPMYSLKHNERNFDITYKNGWEEDDDDWYKKQNTWRFTYKPHRFIDGLPLSYSGYFEYGFWKNEDTGVNSWHKEYAVYLTHDPIYLFNSKNTVLNLRVGKKWVHESYNGETEQTNVYSATLAQKLSSKWDTWIGWHREDETSSLFDIGQPDMAKEIRNGLRWKIDDKNTFTIVNRYDIGKGQQYSTKYSWEHKFCCWMLAFEYEQEQLENDSTRRIVYYFYNL
ncbi:MAG: LPS export ABC transporter periplasmic protein LptC [Phascolarctobacterium sp.]|nr:LPS export ABC transporter periplasmic protein LptC [Phascolarctobacterium sp.]